jgi:hypothetical protein
MQPIGIYLVRGIFVLGGLVIVAGGGLAAFNSLRSCAARVSSADRTAILAALASGEQDAKERDQERLTALAATRVVPRPDLGACPVTIEAPGPPQTSLGMQVMFPRRSDRLELSSPEEVLRGGGPRAHAVRVQIESVRDRLDKGFELPSQRDERVPQLRASAEGLRAVERMPFDATLIVDARVDPRPEPSAPPAPGVKVERRFHGGSLRGRFYVWSYQEKAIVCAALVDATSSDLVRTLSTQHDLDTDLEDQALRAAVAGLARAGAPR